MKIAFWFGLPIAISVAFTGWWIQSPVEVDPDCVQVVMTDGADLDHLVTDTVNRVPFRIENSSGAPMTIWGHDAC